MMCASRLALFAMGLFALFGLGLPRQADARANYGCNQASWVPVQFVLPNQISLPANPTYGTVLWTSSPTAASGTAPALTCKGTPRNGLQNHINGNPASGTIFNTYAAGLGYQIIRSDTGNPIAVYPGEPTMPANNTFNLSYQLQLIWTGPIASGQTLGSYELGSWNVSVNNGDSQGNPVIDFQTSGMVTLAPPACTVAIDPTVVQLPTVTVGALGGSGATTGTTPFAVRLSCASTAPIKITLDSINPIDVNNGVLSIAGGTGAASGVGVQLTYNGAPVKLQSAITVNATQGPFSIPFAASYYRSTGTLQAGTVRATATYTLTYP